MSGGSVAVFLLHAPENEDTYRSGAPTADCLRTRGYGRERPIIAGQVDGTPSRLISLLGGNTKIV